MTNLNQRPYTPVHTLPKQIEIWGDLKMATSQNHASPEPAQQTSLFPTAYTILFPLIIAVAALTWIIPVDEYERATNVALGKDIPLPGTYAAIEAAPQGLLDVLMAPIAGFFDPSSYSANAIDVSLFVLIVGGFLNVLPARCAINNGVVQPMRRLERREQWMILILFTATFVVMVWGVSSQGWWMAKMSAVFLGAAIVIGTLGWLGEKMLITAFIDSARDLLGVALLLVLALMSMALLIAAVIM